MHRLDIAPAIRKAKPNKDGSFNIKILVALGNSQSFIQTPYNIDNLSQWKNGRVVRRADAEYINTYLMKTVMELCKIRDESQRQFTGTSAEAKNWLLAQLTKTDNIVDFGQKFSQKLLDDNRISYGNNMKYTVKDIKNFFGPNMGFSELTLSSIEKWERWLYERGLSSTSVNIKMAHLKVLVNAAIDDEIVEYRKHPFRKYRMPPIKVRDLCISRKELTAFRDADVQMFAKSKHGTGDPIKRFEVARDLFMLSFYMGGINLTDIYEANVNGDVFTFIRKKTARSKTGEKLVSLTIQPEARLIINKYIQENGTMDFGYGKMAYRSFLVFITKALREMGEVLGFEKKLIYYSARKTFCQFGYELGVPLYVLEYAIGQTIKDAQNRPIFNYIKIMRTQADAAIRSIIDYSLDKES